MKKIFNFFRALLPVRKQIQMAMRLLYPTRQDSNGVHLSPAGDRRKAALVVSAMAHTALLPRGGGSCSSHHLKRTLSIK